MKTTVTIEIDTDKLSAYTDSYLAQLWHVAQANPAPHGDPEAGQLVGKLTHEILRRWLKEQPAELFCHQVNDHLLAVKNGIYEAAPVRVA